MSESVDKNLPHDVNSELISFVDFLQSTPPSQKKLVKNALRNRDGSSISLLYLAPPQLLLHCPTEMCTGPRAFRSTSVDLYIGKEEGEQKDVFSEYICSNCRQHQKRFSLNVEIGKERTASVYKYGELPSFGPATPTRLLKLLGDQKETFLKGRRCESQGLGIGAFSYYRRVVENQKNRILDEIIKVSTKLGATKESIAELERAKAEHQFLKSVESVKHGIPQTLLINGHNPLTLLHSALSVGLHDQTDEKCLELAHDVRVVLGDMSDRLSSALKDEVELNAAVGRLLRVRE